MANTVAILSNANTFSEWLVATNASSQEINSIGKANWRKDTGTLYLDGSPLSLQVNSTAIFAAALQVSGIGSSASIQNNLQVDGQIYFTNTTLGLTNTGRANIGGVLFALSPNTGLMVANTANVGGRLNVTGAVALNNTLSVTANTTLNSYLAVTNDISGNNITLTNNINGRLLNISDDGTIGQSLNVGNNLLVASNTITNTLQANSSVNTTTLTVTGSGTVNILQANSSVNTTTLTVTGSGTVNTLQANSSVNTTTLTVTGSGTVNTLQSNVSVNTTTLTVTGSGTVNALQANASVNTRTLTVTGNGTVNILQANSSVITNTLQANSSVNTTTLTVVSSGTVNILQANSSVNTRTLTVTGSGTVNTLQANSSVNTATLTVTGSGTVNTLQANSSVNTTTLTVTGSGTVNTLQANTSVNTTTLTVTGSGTVNTLQANSSVNTTTLTVTGNGTVNILQANSSVITNTLQANSSVNTTTLTVTGSGTVNTLQSNVSVNTASLTVTGSGTVNTLQANSSVNTTTLTVTGNGTVNILQANSSVITNTLQSNSSVNTASLTVTGSGTVNTLQANTSVNTASLTVTGSGTVNILQANSSVNTNTLTVVSSGTVNTLQANSSVNTASLTVTGSGTVNTLQANTSVNTTTLTVVSSGTVNALQANASVNTTTLTVTGSGTVNTLQANTSVNTATITVAGSGTVNTLQANVSVNTASLTVTGSGTVNALQANASVNTRTLTVTGNGTVNILQANSSVITNTLQANSSVNTTTITVTGSGTVNALQANASVNTRTLTVTGSGTVDTLQANASVNTRTLTVTGSGTVDTLQANASVNTASLTVTGSGTVNILQANTSVNTGALTATSGIFGSLQSTGALVVGGDFQINGTTIYNSNTFTLNASGISLPAATSSFSVYRPTANANATIRWNETSGFWDINDISGVNANTFYRLLTTNTVSGLQRAIAIGDGGTNQTAFTNGQITYFDGTRLNSLAVQTPSTAGLSTANTITGITVDSYGRLTSLPNARIAIANTQVSGLATSSWLDTSNANNITTGTLSTSRLPGSGVTAAIYGGATQIPVVTIDSFGRVTSAANVAVTTTLTLAANSGSGSISGGGTLTVVGGVGVTTSVTGSTYTITNSGVNTITGTTNQITANASTGNILLSLPQNINTTATPTFSNVTASVFTGALYGNANTATNISGILPVANGGTGVTVSTGTGSVVLNTSPVLITPNIGIPTFAILTSATGLPLTTGVTGTLPVLNGGTGVTVSTGTGSVVLNTNPILVTPNIGTPSFATLTNATGLPLTTGVTGTLPVTNGGTGVTVSTGTGFNVLNTSPVLVTPNIGTPTFAILTSATGLPLTTGVTGTLPVTNGGTGVTVSTGTGSVVLNTNPIISLTNGTGLPLTTGVTGTLPVTNGGTGVTLSTGTGSVVLNTNPILVTPNIGTPSFANLTSATGLPLTTGVTGTLPVLNGGTGVTVSTGTGYNVLNTNPILVTPNIGTPSFATLTNATGLSLTTGVTGTLPVANGGTGVTVSTGTGSVVLNTNPIISLTNGTGLPLTTGVTGTLPVTNGGTGVTVSTGTGYAVLNTSPILVTPNIGTPSFATLTSATGLPLTTGVTGTLPVLNGGTGVTVSTGTGYAVLNTNPILVTPNVGTPSFARLTSATGLPLTTGVTGTLPVSNGGTNGTSFTTNQIAYFNGTSIVSLANTGTAGSYGNSSHVPVITTDGFGRVSGTTNTRISIANTQVTGLATSSWLDTSNAANITAGTLASARLTGSYTGITTVGTLTGLTVTGTITSNVSGSAATISSTTSNTQFFSIGVGTAASANSGEIRATNNITAYYSDDRLKTRIGVIDNALAKLMTLNGFYYHANETAQALGYSVQNEVGVSAQEVQSVLPEIVVPAPIDEKYLTVRYEKLIPLLIEAIKEQHTIITKQDSRIERLESLIDKLIE